MRRVLVFSVLLLALVALRGWRQMGLESGAEGRVAHRLVSTGWGLPPARKLRPLGLGAVWIGSQWFVPQDGADGLRVAATTVDGEVIDFFNYDLERPAEVRLFRTHCANRPLGTVLSLALRGTLRVPDPKLRGHLGTTLERLGARSAPLESETASWALVVRRTRAGWKRLGEACSLTRGVVLTVPSLSGTAPLELIEGGEPQVVSWIARQRQGEPHEGVRLGWSMPQTTCDGLRFGFGPRGEARPFEIEVDLGARPRFTATLAVAPGLRDARVEFVLSVDGTPLARRGVRAGGEPVSEPWEVDLAAYAGRSARLELSVTGSGALWAGVGTPLVLFDALD